MGYGVRDKETGKLTFPRFLLRHPLFDDQKTLYNYNKPKPTYFYGNINPNTDNKKYRWRGTGEGFTEMEVISSLKKSLSGYFPSAGYILREPADDLTHREAHEKSIGKLVRVKNDSHVLGFTIRYGSFKPSFIYLYFERTKGYSRTYLIKGDTRLLLGQDVHDKKLPLEQDAYDPYN